jgi:hypothetical protein
MKVIALRGVENSGKSHVINIVYHYLLKEMWTQVPGYFRILGNPKFEDILDILTKDGILVGIIGAGDYQKGRLGLANLIALHQTNGCDVVICACRKNHKIEACVLKYSNHIWIDKTLSPTDSYHRIANSIDAQRIYREVVKP